MNLLGLTLNGKPAGEVTIRPWWPLDRTVLCLDCEAVYETAAALGCPACASPHGQAIGRALNRPATPAQEVSG